MAIYCSEECEETGSCCDYCIFYQDSGLHAGGDFRGDGLCLKKGVCVEAYQGCDDDFHCSLAK